MGVKDNPGKVGELLLNPDAFVYRVPDGAVAVTGQRFFKYEFPGLLPDLAATGQVAGTADQLGCIDVVESCLLYTSPSPRDS